MSIFYCGTAVIAKIKQNRKIFCTFFNKRLQQLVEAYWGKIHAVKASL